MTVLVLLTAAYFLSSVKNLTSSERAEAWMVQEDDPEPLEMAKGVREEVRNAEAERARLAELRKETAVGSLAS